MRKWVLIAVLSATVIPSFALAAKQVVTPSGQPDAVFKSSSLTDTTSKIANGCMNKGWAIASQTTNQVICEIPVGAMTAAFQQVLLGNSYSTTPRTYARFSVAQLGENARVQAAAWVETQMAFGQMRQQPYTDDNTFNVLEGFLLQAGGQLPIGSRYPGIYIGFNGEPQIEGKKVFIPIAAVFEGGPGADAGLRQGDRITKVNGQAFKNMEDWAKKLNRVGVGARYPLEIERDGQLVTLSVLALERPAVGTPDWLTLENSRLGAAAHLIGDTSSAKP